MPTSRRRPRLPIAGCSVFLGAVLLASAAFAQPLAHHLALLEAPAAGGCVAARDASAAYELTLDPEDNEYTGWLRAADRITFALRRTDERRFRVFEADVEGELAVGEAVLEDRQLRFELRAGRGPCRAGSYRFELSEPLAAPTAAALRDRCALLYALKRDIEQSWEPQPQIYGSLPDLLARTVALIETLLGSHHPETLLARAYRAESFTLAQRTAEGLAELESVMAEQARVLPALDHDLLRSRHFRIDMLVKLNRGAEAFAEAQALAADAETALDDRHPLRWRLLGSLVRRYMDARDYARAGDLAQTVSTRLAELVGPDHLEAASFQSDLAEIKRMLFRDEEAIAILEPLLRAQTQRLGSSHAQALSTADVLARAYFQVGRWREGLPLAEQVRAIAMREFPPGDAWRRYATDNLAWLYRELGRYADAEALLREALASGIEEFGESQPTVIETRSQLALTLLARKRFAAAYAEADLAYRLASAGEGEASHRALWMRSIRIQALDKLGRCEEVIVEARAAIAGLRRLHGDDTMFANPNEVAAARCASRLGRHEEAITHLQALLAKLARVSPNLKLGRLIVLAELGDAERRAGALVEAARTYAQFVEEGEQVREMVGPIDEYRRGFLERWAIYYRRLAAALLQLGEPGEAFSAVERVKGRGLLETLSSQAADGAMLLAQEERVRLRELAAALSRQDQRLAETAIDSPLRGDVLHAKAEAARTLNRYREELGQRYPKYAQLTRIKLRGVGDAPNLISRDEVFLSYAVVDDSVLIFAYTRARGLETKQIAVPGSMTELVRAYRSFFAPARGEVKPLVWKLPSGEYRLSYFRPEKNARELRSPDVLARRLSELLLAPVRGALEGKRKWIIAPDQSLALLPFEALQWKGEPVLARHDLRYVQSLSVLGELLEQKARRGARPSLFAMGDPDYHRAVLASVPEASPGQSVEGGVARFAPALSAPVEWPRLPGAAREVQRSAAAFPFDRRSVYVGAAASEEKLQAIDRAGELAGYRYLLFATHALLNTESPQLSSVVLAQNAPTAQADGYVTAVKWVNYHLASDMIVLSACETALGQDLYGEGVTGLPYAMMVAGTRSALLTLWRLDDRFAARFVPTVFAALRSGRTPTAAVNAAKRAMLRDREFSSPRFWAAFVLYGS